MTEEQKYKPRPAEGVPAIPWHYPFESADDPVLSMSDGEFSTLIRERRKLYDETHCPHAKRLDAGCHMCDALKAKAPTKK
jgi:hypothetical protein